MTPYKKLIVSATGCSEKDAETVEDWMRDQVNTLDHLSRRQFNALAREAHKALLWSRTPDGKAYTAQLEKEFYEPLN